MAQLPPSQLTQLLEDAGQGDAPAREKLWTLVYDELHSLARLQMVGEAAGRTLQPTALVHEVFLRLFGGTQTEFSSRRHFFGAAARAMRQIRTDDARRRKRLKRGAGQRPESFDEDPPIFDQDPAEVLAVSEALDKLEREDPRKAEVVTLRYFAGLTRDETAAALGVSPRTIDNEWRFARAWLYEELSKGDTATDQG